MIFLYKLSHFGAVAAATQTSPLRVIPGRRRKKLPNPMFLILMFVFLTAGIIILGQRGFEEVIEYDQDGDPRLTPEREAEIKRAKDKLDEAEVYMLLSLYDHYIECLLCTGGRL